MLTKILMIYVVLDIIASLVIYVAILKKSKWMNRILSRLI